jgi:hypothetical protein
MAVKAKLGTKAIEEIGSWVICGMIKKLFRIEPLLTQFIYIYFINEK